MNIEELRQLCDRATPGPWLSEKHYDADYNVWCIPEASDQWGDPIVMALHEDADFIAVARTALPSCLDEIYRLRAELAYARLVTEPNAAKLRAAETAIARARELCEEAQRVADICIVPFRAVVLGDVVLRALGDIK